MRTQLAIAQVLESQKTEVSVPETPPETRSDNAQPSEQAIRDRSLQIWESEGRPDGRAEEHWNRARAELAELLARTSNAHLQHGVAVAQPIADDAPVVALESAPEVETPDVEAPDSAAKTLHQETGQERDFVALNLLSASAFSFPINGEEKPSSDSIGTDLAPDPLSQSVSPDKAVPIHLPPARNATSTVPSLICAGIEMHGRLESPGDIQFGGFMEGTLCGATLVIDHGAVVQGEVIADEVIVRGHVKGRVCAHRVVLRSGSHVEGDILYGSLTIENGAELDGTFRHLETAQEP